jgi:hypothetical protein
MVPKEYREDPSLKDYKDFGSFVKSHVHLNKLVGAEPRVPPRDAPPDMWDKFYSALGRPDVATAYQLPAAPEGHAVDPDFLSGMSAAFHGAGLSNSQAHKVTEAFYGLSAQMQDANAATLAAQTELVERELRREMGSAFEPNIRHAQKLVKDFGGDEALEHLEVTGKGSDPTLIRLFVKIARAMSEDRLGASRPSDFGHTPAEAINEINRLNFDKEFQTALHDSQHPAHKAAVDRKRALWEAAYPTEEPT